MGRLLSFIEGVLFLCACCLVLSNCGSNGCVDNRSSIPLAQFYSYDAQETALSVDSISIFGIGQPTDSMLLDSAVAVTQFIFRCGLHKTRRNMSFITSSKVFRLLVITIRSHLFIGRIPISCRSIAGRCIILLSIRVGIHVIYLTLFL